MKWNELFFIDWHPDVIPAFCVCFHAAAEMRSELAANAAKTENGERVKCREERKTDKQIGLNDNNNRCTSASARLSWQPQRVIQQRVTTVKKSLTSATAGSH